MKRNLIKKIADKLYELEELVLNNNGRVSNDELETLAKEIAEIK